MPDATVPRRKVGRPSYVPTDAQREMVRQLVAGAVVQERIALALGISQSTLIRHYRHEIAVGSTEIDYTSINTLVKEMKKGGAAAVTAAKWWQQARMGWSEKVVVDNNAPPAPMRVVVELIGEAADRASANAPAQTGNRLTWGGPNVKLVG